MKIDKYIADLLFVYDCVVIPGFGGFVCNYSPAKIKNTQHTFYPPHKQLAFNINLKNNDGLLANHVAVNENLSYTQAMEVINTYVSELNKSLQEKKKAEIEEVGVFFADKYANLTFEQSKELNFLLESFGLTTFQSPAIKREGVKKIFDKPYTDRPSVVAESPRVKIKKAWAAYLAVPLGLFMVVSMYSNDFKKNVSHASSTFNPFTEIPASYAPRTNFNGYKTKEIKIETAEEYNIPVKAEVNDLVETKASSNLSEESNLTSKTVSVSSLNHALDSKKSATANFENKKFHLIGGCFSSVENAQKLVNELQSKGYAAYILDQKNGLSRVSFGAFDDKNQALQTLSEVKSNENPGAWLYSN